MPENILDAAILKELSVNNSYAQFTGTDAKIVVLDDDPTGVQTVNNVSVYTDWSKSSILQGFNEPGNMFFILTNSRGFLRDKTERVHEEIAKNVCEAARETGKDFILISRGDSTLRGHYPLETLTLKNAVEKYSDKKISGEIICPFFPEGGRYTIGNVHYVKENDKLVPAAMTEFALDKTFGYKNSDLGKYCEEKTNGEYKAENMIYIPLETLKEGDVFGVKEKLVSAVNFNKIIVNAVCYKDLAVFCEGLNMALKEGKSFMIRSAAALPKVLGGVKDIPLLKRDQMVNENNKNGGIIIVGSHVKKTTRQLELLKEGAPQIDYIEFDANKYRVAGGLKKEAQDITDRAEDDIKKGITVCVYTSRAVLDFNGDKEAALKASVEISDALTSVITKLNVTPSFIVAKGGITSSDVGTKGLGVKKAVVLGQPAPGIPVWQTGEESKFPGLPYVIFPGNVGEETTLRDVVKELMQ